MANSGVIYKRCGCRDRDTRQRLEHHCPKLEQRRHGSWYFDCSLPNLIGCSERKRKGGYPTQAAARKGMTDWVTQTRERRTAHGWTLARWLRYWLSTRSRIRPTTRLHYTRDVELFLIPFLGTICLANLDYRRLTYGFDRIAASTNGHGRHPSPSTLQHLRTTLRAALNLAVRQGILTENPARRLHIPGAQRAVAQVWTAKRVQEWLATGQRPAVAVWTVAHLAEFLNSVLADRLFALWWLVALRGLRRGEAAGLRWSDIDFTHRQMYVMNNRATAGYQVIEGPPKSAAGLRVIALDRRSIAVLREHLRRQLTQRAQRLAAGKDWYESGYLFTRTDGRPLHPGYLTHRFHKLVDLAGVPPIRLHDLRHGAASLAHEAGADLKTVQDLLGHQSIVITADTYTSVLPDIQRKAAEASAHLVLKAARLTREKIRAQARLNRPAPHQETGAPTPTSPSGTQKRRSKPNRRRRRH